MKPFQFLSAISWLALVGAQTFPLRIRNPGTTSSITATQFGTVFDVPITIGNQTFQALVDTGSSDTYVMRNSYKCIHPKTSLEIPQKHCLYSNHTYHVSKTYRQVPNENFGIKYGAGIASGVMAHEDVTLNGITVKGQKVGIADRSNPMGDELNSGLLGLAYPSITSAHPGNHSDNTTYWYYRRPYDPLLFSMHKQGLIDPYFSIALARTSPNASTGFGGYLTLGGLPPVKHSPEWSVVPVEITEGIPLNYTSGQRVRSYWTMTVSRVVYGASANKRTTNTTSFQAFVDVGNSVSVLPAGLANPINAAFSPPAVFDPKSKMYIVDCNAKAPEFGLTIGDQTFFHRGADIIYKVDEKTCITAIASSDTAGIPGLPINIIGAAFLKNAVSVFDFGKNEMRFAKLLDVKKH
ncbi:hypothetical protein NUU61_003998 [Penicillium alfredii]|uniref:penicillopepsin n=1 Tax=Penicillium alfredii TaxID=1506179 RepID=A0A9W9KDE5_9EURO|nr:uncharacterized protein NUU61_003998 [Penicillium alfredii]KAJ5101776.1 hypothetical protein NUU61_003998 [Penicillium alfredii]